MNQIRNRTMRDDLKSLSDRELLEEIYVLLRDVHRRLDKIDDDERVFGINVAADLFCTMLQQRMIKSN